MTLSLKNLETTRAATSKLRGEPSNYFMVGSKLHKRVDFGSCSGRDFSVMFYPISKKFTVLERVI